MVTSRGQCGSQFRRSAVRSQRQKMCIPEIMPGTVVGKGQPMACSSQCAGQKTSQGFVAGDGLESVFIKNTPGLRANYRIVITLEIFVLHGIREEDISLNPGSGLGVRRELPGCFCYGMIFVGD